MTFIATLSGKKKTTAWGLHQCSNLSGEYPVYADISYMQAQSTSHPLKRGPRSSSSFPKFLLDQDVLQHDYHVAIAN